MKKDSQLIRNCKFCQRKISSDFSIIGLSIICPHCHKPQEKAKK